jgi:nicotinate dehydrogenase subunit B
VDRGRRGRITILDDGAALGETACPVLLIRGERGMTSGVARPARPWDLSEPEERDWFRVLGDGLAVVWPPQADREWPRAGGAWLHIAPSGIVTAFTGKVDIGQDNQTAFRLVVAEELAVDPEDVRIVQGDTDLCPYDAGTFGSRSMRDSGDALRRAAAGARQLLIGIAAARLGCLRAHFTAERRAVVCGLTGLRLPYGTLVAGARRAEVLTAEPTLTSPGEWSVAGRPHAAPRLDAVTGSRCFVSDMRLRGMLHGAVLRPPAPGAVLRAVDCGPAEVMPGVTVVRDGEFIGAAAADHVTARRAVAAIKADWDEPALGPADVATTAYLAHVSSESRAAVAEWDDGRLTVWTGTTSPFAVRARLSSTFRISEAAIRVIVPPVGGGSGGKHGEEAVEAARLARTTFRPVIVHWSRAAEPHCCSSAARPGSVLPWTNSRLAPPPVET